MSQLLTTSQLRAVQKIGERGMNVTAEIYSRAAQAKDDPTAYPYGDEDVRYGTPTTVKGWLVTKPTERMEMDAGQVQVISTHQLRVPVGTRIRSGDHVKVNDEEFVVTDATNEQSWPEWTVAYLRGYEGG